MRHITLAVVVLAVASLQLTAQSAKKTLPRETIVEQMWSMAPAARMELIAGAIKKGDFAPAERGTVADAVIERASLDAAKISDIVCRVAPDRQHGIAIIKWVVEDGQRVKKGDKVIEFDATPLEKELDLQKRVVAGAANELAKTEANLQRVQKDNAIDVKLAAIDVRLAELALKQYKGNEADQRQILALQVDRANLLLMRVKVHAEAKEEKVAAERQAKKAVHERALAAQKGIQEQIAKCVMHAPQDGMAVYVVPEQRRGGGPGGAAIVAQGEPVREEQKLLRICDLKQMVAIARIAESVIHKVRVGQKTAIRVDAFPQRVFTGKVTHVANTADQTEFFTRDVKVYRVEIMIDANDASLRPGMSAETAVSIAERPNCLRLPEGTILTRNKEKYCYVQVDKELQMRKLTIGLTDGSFVEVVDGLKEGDSVLRYPQVVIDRIVRMKSK